MNLAEKYRPAKLEDIVGHKEAIEAIKHVGYLGGHAFIIEGPSGSGKTSLARIMAATIADRWTTIETTGRETWTEFIKEFRNKSRMLSLTGKGWALIINEAHGLPQNSIELFLDYLEKIAPDTIIVFTTSRSQVDMFGDKLDSPAFLSRCITITLKKDGLEKAFAKKAKEVARLEHLDGRPLADYVNLVKACNYNQRQVYMKIEAGEMQVGN